MPANRSRTENWRQSLQQVYERGGGLEIAIGSPAGDAASADGTGGDLIFRVRIFEITERDIVIESPAAVGRSMHLGAGVPIVASMTIGQNRWMFRTATNGHRMVRPPMGPETAGVVLAMPGAVERCPRRQHFRVSTAELRLPRVECWPLLDPASVAPAENASRLALQDAMGGASTRGAAEPPPVLPDVGPMFSGRLVNVSGGGLGLLVAPDQAAALNRQPFVWMRLDLRPHLPLPVALTARRVHTHLDAAQNIYAGFSFEFAFNPAHQRFVTEVMTACVDAMQRAGARAAA
ncbi:MAG: hypothetical protein JNJ48_00980 [Phycisphaerae bacterium]|nr:hypothetical protein [Phycisphaerae bacterium]